MNKHVMIDLETMGSSSFAAPVTIGAVKFDPVAVLPPLDEVAADDKFYVRVSLESAMRSGLKVEAATICWWLDQTDAARREISDDQSTLTLDEALDDLARWFRPSVHAWSHGATFDLVILSNAYRLRNKTAPWKFWDLRDTRTIYDLASIEPTRDKETHHHALHDAYNQAIAVQQAYTKLGINT